MITINALLLFGGNGKAFPNNLAQVCTDDSAKNQAMLIQMHTAYEISYGAIKNTAQTTAIVLKPGYYKLVVVLSGLVPEADRAIGVVVS